MQPCAVITNSCQSIPPQSIIKGILEEESLPDPFCILPDQVQAYPWHISTKYYDADIHLCSLEKKSIGTQDFADSVNALIIPFDASSMDGLSVVEQWLSFTKEFEAEVQILICNHCVPDGPEISSQVGLSRLEVQTWCVENGFELVELNPVDIEEDSDVEDDFPESTGIKRVIQALHAHMWPNLIMKETTNRIAPVPGLQRAVNGVENVAPTENNRAIDLDNRNTQPVLPTADPHRVKLVAEVKPLPKDESPKLPSNVAVVSPTIISPAPISTTAETTSIDPVDLSASGGASQSISTSTPPVADPSASKPSPTRDERLAMLEAVEAMPDDSFEALFQNLNAMKTKAESLSPSQRKAYAEQMAVAFWKSIGGNESEIEGISGDDSSDAD